MGNNPNLDVLSQRYATDAMNYIFSERGKITLERDFWLAVMKKQKQHDVNISSEDIEKFERAKDNIDLNLINRIEKETGHDIKAKIEAYVLTAGAKEVIHLGMTARDLTDNVEQTQNKRASQIIFNKNISILRHLSESAEAYGHTVLTARTHHQAAQPTLAGRRIAMWAEEIYAQLKPFETFIENYPMRGIKGPVGTQADMLRLLGSSEAVEDLERSVAATFGFNRILCTPGQVYPRSLDYQLITHLALLSAGCENFAKGIRLMAGYELATEGFKEGQVGSTAMPHKMNTPHSERITGISELLKMYADGASRLSGDQWEEGDVSCSVVRRVILPQSFYAADGLCETTLNVAKDMGFYFEMIKGELERYLPFLATTQILSLAVSKGIGREIAHAIIKKYAVDEALNMRNNGKAVNTLFDKLAADTTFLNYGIKRSDFNEIVEDVVSMTGNAYQQIRRVNINIYTLTSKYPEAAKYEPEEIL